MPPYKTPQSRRKPATEAEYYDNVESIRASLEEIAKLAAFVRKWTPYLIGAIGVLYPTFGKIVQAIGQHAGVHG